MQHRLVVAAVLLVAGAGSFFSTTLNVWQDEIYTLHSTSHGLAYAIHQAIYFEQNAPLYFAFMSLWRSVNESLFWTRFFSTCCATGAVALVPAIVRRYAPAVPAGFATLIVAVNPFLLWTACEARLYALVILLSATALVAFHEAFLRERMEPARVATCTLLFIVCAYTQYFLLFLIAALGAYLVLSKRDWRRTLAFAGSLAVVGAAFAPLLATLSMQMTSFMGPKIGPRTLFEAAHYVGAAVVVFILPLLTLPFGRWLYVIAGASIVAYLIWHRKDLRRSGDPALPIITAAAFTIFALALWESHEAVSNRHVASLFLPSVLSTAALSTLAAPGFRERLFYSWMTLSMVACLAGSWVAFSPMAKLGDWQRVARYVEAGERENEPIMVFTSEPEIGFAYYYRGKNAVIPVPHSVNFAHYDVRDFILKNESQLQSALPHPLPRELWLIRTGNCIDVNVSFGCPVLASFVRKHYDIRTTRAFYRATVILLSLRESSSPSTMRNADVPSP